MLNRYELAQHFKELGFKKGAEIGVANGYFSSYLCNLIPDLHLICVDDWANSRFAPTFKKAQRVLEGLNVEIIRKKSTDAAKDIPDESLDFVYIDANHGYHYVKQDIREWTKKVRKGGIVSGDDYYFTPNGNDGVIIAVNRYAKINGYKVNITQWDIENVNRDSRCPQWWFVKEGNE